MANEARIRITTKDETRAGIQSAVGGMKEFAGSITTVAAKFVAVEYAARRAFQLVGRVIGVAYGAVEEYNLAVTKTAALVASMMPGDDLLKRYQTAREYAEGLYTVMEDIAAQTLASGSDLQTMTEEMIKQGIILDVNNKKAIDGFRNVANAVAVIIAGAPAKEVQLRQELRALLQGQVNMYSQLASQVDAMVGGGLKKMVEQWKEQGTLMENLGGLLSGFAVATGDIENTWMAIGTTMKTIRDQILREGFRPAYKEINEVLNRINYLLKEHRDEIATTLLRLWTALKGTFETIGNLLRPFTPVFDAMLWAVSESVKGWGMLASSVLPVVSERFGLILTSLVDIAKMAWNLGRVLWSAFSLDLEGLKAAWGDVKKNFADAGQHFGDAFAAGAGDEIERRLNKYLKDIETVKKSVPTPETKATKDAEAEEKRLKEIEKLNKKILEATEKRRLEEAKGTEMLFVLRREQVEKQAALWLKEGADRVAVEAWTDQQMRQINKDRIDFLLAEEKEMQDAQIYASKLLLSTEKSKTREKEKLLSLERQLAAETKRMVSSLDLSGLGVDVGPIMQLFGLAEGTDIYTERINRLQQFWEKRVQLEYEGNRQAAEQSKAFQTYTQNIERLSAERRLASTKSLVGGMSNLFGQLYEATGRHSKAMFKLHQAFSAGEAIISTYAGAARALKDFPYPVNIAIAALVTASGLARVASIMAQRPGGAPAGAGAAGAGLPPGPTFPEVKEEERLPVSPVINVNIYGHVVDHDQFAREIVPSITKAISDNVE